MEGAGENPEIMRNLPSETASQTEVEFVRALSSKMDWAYLRLVSEQADRLFNVAFRFLRDAEEAKETVQDVFRKVVEKIGTFKGESKFSTWIYRITVNEALMRIRERKGKETISWEEILPKYQDGIWMDRNRDWSPMPESQLLEKEALEYLRKCIQELPEDYRAPYILKDVEQLSEAEVCDALGIEKGVMKIRVHRARMFLRKRIEEHYVV